MECRACRIFALASRGRATPIQGVRRFNSRLDFQTHRRFELFSKPQCPAFVFFANSSFAAEGSADDSRLLGTHSSSFTQFLLTTATAVTEARSAAQRRASFFRL